MDTGGPSCQGEGCKSEAQIVLREVSRARSGTQGALDRGRSGTQGALDRQDEWQWLRGKNTLHAVM